ncbi:Glycine/D-amino acid oxidase [Pustulibacterium marinum]|uniref:Glycine/D-amino acid oxidase n=1 Tax=Pustulibacterium marinum TaxID=1224947 RepID=A0A1I7EUL1_9FLAO|nr:FAD-dependent oxidoreductase [Pustulibacterium marinum]SFU27588.1 Glycine/D-amino acid oxidase [Pustulibacterium marinum]
MFSYWEYKNWITDIDFAIVGSGIVGLNCALALREKYPSASILVLEKGVLPQGASTKNAGFACFGSLSELLDDLNTHDEDEMVSLVKHRWEGLQALRTIVGDDAMEFQQYGGNEIFLKGNPDFYESCLEERSRINKLLHPLFHQDVFEEKANDFHFGHIQDYYISNTLEGQLDTGKMMNTLLKKAYSSGIKILNSIQVEDFQDLNGSVSVQTNMFDLTVKKLFIATNGYASDLGITDVKPARAQVLITKPIANLPVKGTFHIEEGYYYFRNVGDRILFGGGRHLDIEGETTTHIAQSSIVQEKLEEMLSEIILPEFDYEIDMRWSGIMGVGPAKRPIVKSISNNVFCGVRLGGMGISIGTLVGRQLAELEHALVHEKII